jgi:MinD superfamily P-loop ATPase containing an inserted ferredoxin domain
MKAKQFTFEDDVIGLVYPCYGFSMPKIVREFLGKVKWKAKYSFAIATYGNKTAAALHDLTRYAAEHGITFDYMNTLLMVDNYLPNFEIGDQMAKLPQKNTENNLKQIVADIQAQKRNKPAASISDKAATAVIQAIIKPFMNGKQAKSFIVNDKCTKCGICAKVCPTGNIVVKDKVLFSEHCEGCFGCVHNCPQNAMHLKSERSAARFRNENVTLREIMDANNQNS